MVTSPQHATPWSLIKPHVPHTNPFSRILFPLSTSIPPPTPSSYGPDSPTNLQLDLDIRRTDGGVALSVMRWAVAASSEAQTPAKTTCGLSCKRPLHNQMYTAVTLLTESNPATPAHCQRERERERRLVSLLWRLKWSRFLSRFKKKTSSWIGYARFCRRWGMGRQCNFKRSDSGS